MLMNNDHNIIIFLKSFSITTAVYQSLKSFPVLGMFARDKIYQREKSQEKGKNMDNNKLNNKLCSPPPATDTVEDDCSSDDDLDKLDDDSRKVLESGGRDCCAYFFWQGMTYLYCERHLYYIISKNVSSPFLPIYIITINLF